MNGILQKYMGEFQTGHGVSGAEATELFDALIDEHDESILAELFRAWNAKGIDADDIYIMAKTMRERCTHVHAPRAECVDIVGTGGSKAKTFNVSTAAAFVLAGEGIPVAKHGNKAATSNSGSADVLSALKIQPSTSVLSAESYLDEFNLCFMFAPAFHRLSPTLATVRRGLGFPTIFNCIGPLCNPTNVPHSLIGVWDKSLVLKMANALAMLGTAKSWIVHGHDGLDEISLSGPTYVAEVENGKVREFEISPEDFGEQSRMLDDCRVETAEQSAAIIRQVLEPGGINSPARSLVEINAAAAVYLTNAESDLRVAAQVVSEGFRSGRAKKKLNDLIEASRNERDLS